jgi:hypothetical protein
MSGGQRKRVTFADLVTARLPSPPSPQQGHGPRQPEIEAEPQAMPLPASPEAPAKAATTSEAIDKTGDLGVHNLATPASADLRLARPLTPATEDVPEVDAAEGVLGGSQSPSDSQPPSDSQSPAARRTFRQAGGGQTDSQPSPDSQPRSDRQTPHDRQPLKEVRGYLRVANTIVDSLLPTLDVYEQAVFVQLYRLAHGFGNHTCKVSLPALQTRTGVKPTSLKQAIARLQARGIVEKISAEIGFGREQGITYWVSPDGRQTYGDWQTQDGSQSPDDDNKRKEHSKENKSKGGLTPEQIKECPDCGGVGMWYPEGPGRGVARCYHPSLRAHS